MKLSAAIRRNLLLTILGVVWLGVVVAGLGLLGEYANRPGVAAHAPSRWPTRSRLTPDHERPTLVMLAHPLCDCTRASIAEFAELMARTPEPPKAYIVFIAPAGTGRDWTDSDLWRAARQIPGVEVVRDTGMVEAESFGVETSGQTLLYGADGRLLFSGGTTGSRGHVGDNAGRASLLALLEREDPHRSGTPVFGCPLFGLQESRRPQGSSYGAI